MDLQVLRRELEVARQERAALLEQASALEPHLGGALTGLTPTSAASTASPATASTAPTLYQTSAQHQASQRLSTPPVPAGLRKLSWGSGAPARARPVPRTAPSNEANVNDFGAEQQQQQGGQKHGQQQLEGSATEELDPESDDVSMPTSSTVTTTTTTPQGAEHARAGQQQQQQQHLPSGSGPQHTAPVAVLEAARKQAYREVLALLLNESPGNSKLDHFQLTAESVAAVARENASTAAAEARVQGEQAAAAAAQERASKGTREGVERAQRQAARACSEAEAAQAALMAQVAKLQAQVEALQKEKKAAEGKAAQLGRDARCTAESLKTARDQVAAAEKLAERRSKEAARAQSEAQKERQEAERSATKAAEEAAAALQQQQAADAVGQLASKMAEKERGLRLQAEKALTEERAERANVVTAAEEALWVAVDLVRQTERQLAELRAEVVTVVSECGAVALPELSRQVAELRQAATQQLQAVQQQAAEWAMAAADLQRLGGPAGLATAQQQLQAALSRAQDAELRVQTLEAAKARIAAGKAQLDAELRMLTRGQAEMRRELAAAEDAAANARAAAQAAETRAAAVEAREATAAWRCVAAEGRFLEAEETAKRVEGEASAAKTEANALRTALEHAETRQRDEEARAAALEISADELREQLKASFAAHQAAEAAADVRMAALVRSLRSRYFRDPAPKDAYPSPRDAAAAGVRSSQSGTTTVPSAIKHGRPPSGVLRLQLTSAQSQSSELVTDDDDSKPGYSAGMGDGSTSKSQPADLASAAAPSETQPSEAYANMTCSTSLGSLCLLGPDEVSEALEEFISRQAAVLGKHAETIVKPASDTDNEQRPERAEQGERDQQVGVELLWLEGCLLLTLAEFRQQGQEAEVLHQQLQAEGLVAGAAPGGAGPSQSLQRAGTAGASRSGAAAGALDAAGSGVGVSPARSLAAQMLRALVTERAELQRRLARMQAASSFGQLTSRSTAASTNPAPSTHYVPARRSLSARSTASTASIASQQSAGLSAVAAKPSTPLVPTQHSPSSATAGGSSPSLHSTPKRPPINPRTSAPLLPSTTSTALPSASASTAQDKARRSSDPASVTTPSLNSQDFNATSAALSTGSGLSPKARQGWAKGSEFKQIPRGGDTGATDETQYGLLSEGSTLSLATSSTSGWAQPGPTAGWPTGQAGKPPPSPYCSSSPLKLSYDVEDVMAILEGLGDVLPSGLDQRQYGARGGQYKPAGMAGSLLGPPPSLLHGRCGRADHRGPAWDSNVGAMQTLPSCDLDGRFQAGGMYGRVAAGRGSALVGGRGSGSRQLTPYLVKQRIHSAGGAAAQL